VYDAVVDWTGTEIPAIGDALKNPKSIKALAKAVGLVGAATGLETYRRGKIDDAAADMKKAFEEGRAWELPGDKNFLDSTGAQIGFSVLSSLGNPVEKTISDFVSGKYSKNVADEARYMVEQDKINEMEKQGRLRPDEASKMRKDLAAKSKPLYMAGPVPRVFTPAAGNAVKWIVGDAIKDAKTPSVYRTVKPSDERDGDTVSTTAGTSIRFKGIDATEIAHAAKMGSTDEPYGREGAERMKELVPDGSTIRLRSDPNNPTDTKDKYGREIGYVERLRGPQIIGKAIATVPGLRDVWPAEDVQQTMIEEGLARAAYENLDPVQHSRAMDYHAAQADAIRAGVKLAGPEGEKLRTQPDQRTGQKKSWWLPKDAVTNPDGTVTLSAERPNLPVWAGAGLMYTGQSGVPGKLGTLGKAIMPSWNAGLAGWGTAVSRQAGPKNTGREYRVPAAFAEDKKRKQWQAELPYWKP